MEIKVKKLTPTAVMPKQMREGDAGFDLVATTREVKPDCTMFGTGLAFEIPKGYAMFIFPRSSSFKYEAMMYNSVGVVDSGYRGEVHVVFKGCNTKYKVGDRIAQAVILTKPEVT